MNCQFLFRIRYALLTFFVLVAWNVTAQQAPVRADVYRWDSAPVVTGASQQRVLLESNACFAQLKVYATTVCQVKVKPRIGAIPTPTKSSLLSRKEKLSVTIDDSTETLEAGSIAFIMPEPHSFANLSDKPVTYYVMRYHTLGSETKSKLLVGQSFVKHWKDLEYKPNDKGGRRNVFDQKTTESERFEMHITTLNKGLMSHPPHTHKAAEILLLIEGQAEESIDGKWIPAGVGDIIFLQSQVPHAIRNTGKGAATYFAFQFE